MQSHPYLMEKKRSEDGKKREGNDQYEGYCVDLANKIFSDILKVPFELRLVADNSYGAKGVDGKWNGMIGELTRQVASAGTGRPINFSTAVGALRDGPPKWLCEHNTDYWPD